MPPWQIADYLSGFLLGLALAGMAIDYGRQHPTTTLPSPPPIAYPGP